jgi:hypothetical protein
VRSARTRGTADLLWSGTFTLTLCVYTVIHLNIPAICKPKWKQYVRKAKWAVIGIFAPEVVLYTAWEQYMSAWELCRKLNSLKHGESKVTPESNEGLSLGNSNVI